MYKVTYGIRREVGNADFPLKEVFGLGKKKLSATKTNDNGKKGKKKERSRMIMDKLSQTAYVKTPDVFGK